MPQWLLLKDETRTRRKSLREILPAPVEANAYAPKIGARHLINPGGEECRSTRLGSCCVGPPPTAATRGAF
jgi:hypothetical protein